MPAPQPNSLCARLGSPTRKRDGSATSWWVPKVSYKPQLFFIHPMTCGPIGQVHHQPRESLATATESCLMRWAVGQSATLTEFPSSMDISMAATASLIRELTSFLSSTSAITGSRADLGTAVNQCVRQRRALGD
jgi:hypothetical protein